MNFFDSSIIELVNSLARRSEFFDNTIDVIVGSNLIKGGFVVSMFWFFWFKKSNKITFNRERIIITMVASLIAIVAARVLALTLPFRMRPFLNPELHFVPPFGKGPKNLEAWSSFPSDHAVLFFSLATGIFLISRKLGIFTYLYVLLFVCFPRLYMGYHYPTDIIMGAAIGVLITLLISIRKISQPFIQRVFQFSEKNPGLFFVLFFLLTFQIATLFSDSRVVGGYIYQILKNLFG